MFRGGVTDGTMLKRDKSQKEMGSDCDNTFL